MVHSWDDWVKNNIEVDESFAEAHLNDARQARTEKQEKNESLPNKH